MDSGGDEEGTKEAAKVHEPALSTTDEQPHQNRALSFQPCLAVSRKTLPIPGARDSASDTSDGNEDGLSENDEDDGDPLTCRESLPSPPSDLEEELEMSPDTDDGDYGSREGDTDDNTDKAAFLLRSLSSSPMQVDDNAPRIHMKLPPRRNSRSPVPVKLPGSSPDKPEPPRKRDRARSLPTASSRKNVSQRGRVQKKRVFEHKDDSSSDPDSLSASTKPVSRSKRAALANTSSTETILNSSMQLAYSWDSLGLGKELGSAALNEYMARLRNNEGVSPYLPDLTAQEMLQIMNSLRVRTYLPPPGSALHRIVQKNRFENRSELYGSEASDDEDVKDGSDVDGSSKSPSLSPPPCSIPFKTMARLYETMCAQDADDGSSNRREAQYLSAASSIEKLRSLENRACELKLKETAVLQKGRELGLVGPMHRLLPEYARVPNGRGLELVSERGKGRFL